MWALVETSVLAGSSRIGLAHVTDFMIHAIIALSEEDALCLLVGFFGSSGSTALLCRRQRLLYP